MDPQVSAYIEKTQPWQQEVCEALRKMVHDTVPGAEERLQYGKPHFVKDGEFIAVIHAGKDKVSFMLFNASDIKADMLRAMGNGDRKVIDIVEGQTVDYKQLGDLLAKVV
jgi:hypothetical protein